MAFDPEIARGAAPAARRILPGARKGFKSACLAAGLLLNALCPEPLDLSYQTRGERLQNTDEMIPEVTLVEARRALAAGHSVFVDAREPGFPPLGSRRAPPRRSSACSRPLG